MFLGDLDSETSKVVKKDIVSKGYPKDPNGHTDEILALDVSFDAKLMVTAGKDRVIRIWDVQKRRYKDCLKGHIGTITVSFYDDY